MAPARLLVAAATALAALGAASTARAEPTPSEVVDEHYVYLAKPEHADSGSEETHTITITSTPAGAAYAFEIRFDDGLLDRGVIATTETGAFVTASRRRYRGDGSIYESDSLRIEGTTLVMETRQDGKTKVSRADCPRDRPLAVDASLLLWMRRFPFGDADKHDVFMADWSHRTVDVDVRDRGIETITVPAGSFRCHRMEVTVRVLVFRPKITFWITVDAPHHLVQHRGKRGPFTPVFETRLQRVETP